MTASTVVRRALTVRGAINLVASVFVVALSAFIVARVPRLAGSTWHDVTMRVTQIGLRATIAIVALWVAGLLVYTVAMTASMPGLSHRRAMALNLSGSSVSNLLPFGGVIGTGLNVAMARSWRLSLKAVASSTAVLNVINLLAKLALPIIAGVVVSRQPQVAPWLSRSAYFASFAAAAVILAIVVALFSRRWAVQLDKLIVSLRRSWAQHRPRRRSHLVPGAPAAATVALTDAESATATTASDAELGPVCALQDQVREVIRSRWLALTAGMTGYVLLQWALFALCLHTAGITSGTGAIFAAFAVERALTLAVVTPAGTGIAEAGATALLVTLGASAPAAAAGVLLYRLFVYLAEIPVGALVLAGWAVRTMPRARTANPPIPSNR